MYKLRYMIFLILLSLINGCGGAAPDESQQTNNPSIISSNSLYVDISKGSNSNSGKKDKPFKTVFYALSKAKSSQTIYVESGLYSENNGERFPLILNNNKIFYASDTNKSIIIEGSGEFEGHEVAIVLKGNNTLQGMTIKSNDNIGVLSQYGNSNIVSSWLTDNKVALAEHNNSRITLTNSKIIVNSARGVELIDSSILQLSSSIIENNNIGINIADNAKILSSSQNSKIINNEQCDLFSNSASNMYLQGIEWDENTSDFNIEKNCVNGNNIVKADSAQGIIIFQHRMFVETNSSNPNSSTPGENNSSNPNSSTPGENNSSNQSSDTFSEIHELTFHNTKKISIIQPAYNQQIDMTNPTIQYKNTLKNKYIMVTIWKNKPNVLVNKIQNPQDIIWYWHTGMNNSNIGYVEYHKGSNPINGKIDTGAHKDIALKQLTSGRSYYLVIWEWDEKGRNIIASSITSIFHVR